MNIHHKFEEIEKLFLDERYEDCKKASEELLEIINDDFDKVELLHSIADCTFKLGNIEDSLPIYSEALNLARNINFLYESILILTMLSDIEYNKLENTNKAIEYLTECIETSKEYNDPYFIQISLTMLARIYYNSNNYSKALILLKEALEYLYSYNQDYIEDYFYINCLIGICYVALGNYDDFFERYYYAAFDLIGKTKNLQKESIKKLSDGYNHSYVFYVVYQDKKNYPIISKLIDKLFPERYEKILYLLAGEEDSYKDDFTPLLLDVLDGKFPLEAKLSAIKAMSYILGPYDAYFIHLLRRKYAKYVLVGIVDKKADEIRKKLKFAIDKIINKK